jgi:hypothetical protein
MLDRWLVDSKSQGASTLPDSPPTINLPSTVKDGPVATAIASKLSAIPEFATTPAATDFVSPDQMVSQLLYQLDATDTIKLTYQRLQQPKSIETIALGSEYSYGRLSDGSELLRLQRGQSTAQAILVLAGGYMFNLIAERTPPATSAPLSLDDILRVSQGVADAKPIPG